MAGIFTPKQRMLNAYRGIASDRYAVAPEFWYYFPAKKLGLSMVEFEREVPLWQSLQQVFKMYGCEGWGAVFPEIRRARVKTASSFVKNDDNNYRDTITYLHNGNEFTSVTAFNTFEPSSVLKHIADRSSLGQAIDMLLCESELLPAEAINAYNKVGEDYLLEIWTGCPFFDFIAGIIGFEDAVLYFFDEEEHILEEYLRRYLDYQLKWIKKCIESTPFESYVIGCSFSCNSLIGAQMWRRWDKPYIEAVARLLHSHGKLLHIHFHGRSIETIDDFAQIGIDCVCPFERPPGGDIESFAQLKDVRIKLSDKVTFNGNVHTVETLIRGTKQDVRREIDEITEAFKGSSRLIIGTGDQVGGETKEENILEMIEYGKSQKPCVSRHELST